MPTVKKSKKTTKMSYPTPAGLFEYNLCRAIAQAKNRLVPGPYAVFVNRNLWPLVQELIERGGMNKAITNVDIAGTDILGTFNDPENIRLSPLVAVFDGHMIYLCDAIRIRDFLVCPINGSFSCSQTYRS